MIQCSRSNCRNNPSGRQAMRTVPLYSCGRCIHNSLAIHPKRDNWALRGVDRSCYQWDCGHHGAFPSGSCRYCWHNPVATHTNGKYYKKKDSEVGMNAKAIASAVAMLPALASTGAA